MNKLPALIAVISLLIMSVISAAHADTQGIGLCDGVQVEALHDSHGHDDMGEGSCDCVSCDHHHHSHASLPLLKAEPSPMPTTVVHDWANVGASYHRHFPPSRPPKA